MPAGVIWLILAILSEVFATSFISKTDGFRHILYTVIVLFGYGLSFFCLSHTVKTIPVGIAYAVWCGLGIILINLIAWHVFKQKLDVPAFLGITLIAVGVLVIQLFSKVSTH